VLLAVGGLLAAFAGREDVMERLDVRAEGALRAAGIILVVLGVVQLVLAVGLIRRRPLARTLIGVTATLQTGLAVYALVAIRDVRGGTIWSFALAVAVLWMLYGSDQTQEYFGR
jgi:hypothetical protein